jgi:hypothetical protein
MTERETILRELSDRELAEFAAAGVRLPHDLAYRAHRLLGGRRDERLAADTAIERPRFQGVAA